MSRPFDRAALAAVHALVLLMPLAALAAPTLDFPATFSEAEGSDDGSRIMEIPVTLSAPAAGPVDFGFDVHSGTAINGVDFGPACGPCTIPAGQTTGMLLVQVYMDEGAEADETFTLTLSSVTGADAGNGEVVVTLLNDDDTPPVMLARPDRFVLDQHASLSLLTNDTFPGELRYGGTIRLGTPAGHGDATIHQGQDDDIHEALVVYIPDSGYYGPDTFTYVLCAAGGAPCTSAEVHVQNRIGADHVIQGSDGGNSAAEPRWVLNNTSPDAIPVRLVPSRLAAPHELTLTLTGDATPETPWDEGGGEETVLVPLAPLDAGRRRVVVVAEGDGDIDLYVGTVPDPDDVAAMPPDMAACIGPSSSLGERCELDLADPSNGYAWIRVHNRSGAAQEVRLEVFDVLSDEDPAAVFEREEFTVTGTGVIEPWGDVRPRFSWHDPTQLDYEWRYAFVDAYYGADRVGEYAVRIQRVPGLRNALSIAPGTERTLRLAAGEAHERVFVDVPHGASTLRVDYEASAPIALHLAPAATTSGGDPAIAPAPPRTAAVRSTTGIAGGLVVDGATLQPGRWYVTPTNAGPEPVTVTLRPTLTALAPLVRPGSYFDPDRAGHGVFLYPAGTNTLTGLWFTYFEDGTPTWLYLQADAPGLDGIWTAGLYRATWHGDWRSFARVGTATLTPAGLDTFEWSWRLDGLTGSERMVSLGRGCPTSGGVEQDASSTWFDPDHAGTGYSTQFWGGDGYEYYAAFVYDLQGIPRFLTAEADAFAGASATLDLDQLSGFCPLCERTGAPTRSLVGVLTRDFADGKLDHITLDAIFGQGVEGSWTADHSIQPLGGPGTTQGCAP